MDETLLERQREESHRCSREENALADKYHALQAELEGRQKAKHDAHRAFMKERQYAPKAHCTLEQMKEHIAWVDEQHAVLDAMTVRHREEIQTLWREGFHPELKVLRERHKQELQEVGIICDWVCPDAFTK